MAKNVKKTKFKHKIKFSRIILFLVLFVVIAGGIYFFLTTPDEESKLTLLEKQWIEKNKNTLIDIRVPNNLNILGQNGEGVLFDFLSNIEEETELRFNKISYDYPLGDISSIDDLGIIVLKNSDSLKENDVLMLEDSYVLLGLNEGFIEDFADITNTKVGVLTDDNKIITSYLGDNINYKSYVDSDSLYQALTKKEVDYIIVPRYANLEKTRINNVYTKYNFNNISNKIVLRLSKDNERLNNIMLAFLENWKETGLRESKELALMNYFMKSNTISDIDKHELTKKVYKYGYVEGSVYNISKNDTLYGVAGEYINTLSNMADIEFDYIEYETNSDLVGALNSGSIDIAFIDFNYEGGNALKSSSPFVETMAAVSSNYQNVSDRNGINNRKLYLKENNYLYDYMNTNYNSILKPLEKINQSVEDDSIIILDEAEYLYYKEHDLSNYKLLFTDVFKGNYHFETTSSNEVLYKLVNFVLNNTDYNEYKNTGINNLLNTLDKEQSFKYIYIIILTIVIVPVLIIIITIALSKNVRNLKMIRKEDILRYNDMLTSLKNRNYLNANINKWDEAKIYPRTVIIIDLNNLKYVNDNYGHKEGNELIKKAAAILINTQLEKSEIVRTDGNEFLIYLIGYNKTQVNNYISKLTKEFEKLPHGFGAAIGYSVIEDEIKTVDDAINEATIEMRKDKENYR